MLRRAHEAGVPPGWVSDAVYGQHSRLRAAIEELGMSYVLAVPVSQHVITEGPRLAGKHRAGDVIAALPTASAVERRRAADHPPPSYSPR